MTIEPAPRPISMMPYALKFTGISALLSIFLITLTELINFDVPSSMGTIIMVAAVIPVAQSFVKKNGRVMSEVERVSFAILSSIFSLFTSLVIFAGFIKLSGFDLSMATLSEALGTTEIPLGFLVIMLAFALVLSWAVLYFCTGWMCKSAMNRLAKV